MSWKNTKKQWKKVKKYRKKIQKLRKRYGSKGSNMGLEEEI